eukprot:TRINITY_DN5929_c0_g1_i2.p1 TRINITY_DN5929_c0_g1~~TRINITY_DN5929_c0_g1_i2.p1  ORF type:complete len:780 (+),score=102.37 TRINITY_DN5929_c0_g1_i2:79-2418(+)
MGCCCSGCAAAAEAVLAQFFQPRTTQQGRDRSAAGKDSAGQLVPREWTGAAAAAGQPSTHAGALVGAAMMTAVTAQVLAAAARRATVAAPVSEELDTRLKQVLRDERTGRRALRSEEREGRGQVRFEKTQDTVCGFIVGTRVVAKRDIETRHRTVAKKGHLGTVQGRQEGAKGVPVLFDSRRQVEIVARDVLRTTHEVEAEAEAERVVEAAGAARPAAAKDEETRDTADADAAPGHKKSEVDTGTHRKGAKAKKRKNIAADADALQDISGVWETATGPRQKKAAGSQLMSHNDLVRFVLDQRHHRAGFWGHWCALANDNGFSGDPLRMGPEVLRQLVVALNAELRLLPDGRLVDPAQEVDAGGRAAARGHPLSPVAHAHAPHQRGPRQEPHGGGQQRGITKQQSLPSAGAGLPAGTAPAPAHPKAALGWRSKGGGPTPIVCPAERDAVPLGAVAAAGSTRCARRGISSGLGGAVFPAVGTLRSTTRAPPSSTSTPPDASPTLPFTAASPGSTVRDASHALEPDSPRSPLLSRTSGAADQPESFVQSADRFGQPLLALFDAECRGREALAEEEVLVRAQAVTARAGDQERILAPLPPADAALDPTTQFVPFMPVHEALMVNNVCHCISMYAPRKWARVCSTTARMVMGTQLAHHKAWITMQKTLVPFLTEGVDSAHDNRRFGSERGLLCAAQKQLIALQNKVGRAHMAMAPPPPVSVNLWLNRWSVYFDVLINLYEQQRLIYLELWEWTVVYQTNHRGVFRTLREVLAHRARRVEDAGGS